MKDTLYARWLNGDLSPSELEQLKKSGELEELKSIIDTLEGASLPPFKAEEEYARFKSKHPSQKAKVRTLRVRWALSAAASVALIVFAFFYLRNDNQSYQAETMANTNVDLLDGSNAVLNDGSSLTYNKRQWKNQRVVELTGEAVFSVEKGTPFSVITKNGNVSVLGTKFNVRAWGDKLLVECYEGRVQVEKDGQEVILTANRGVTVENGQIQEPDSIGHLAPLWTTGTSSFFEEGVEEVFAELERQFGVNVTLPPTKRKFNGDFRHNDLENAIKAICVPLGFSYTISDDQKEISIDLNNE